MATMTAPDHWVSYMRGSGQSFHLFILGIWARFDAEYNASFPASPTPRTGAVLNAATVRIALRMAHPGRAAYGAAYSTAYGPPREHCVQRCVQRCVWRCVQHCVWPGAGCV